MHTLLACRGTGSAIIEGLLDLTGLPYAIREIDHYGSETDRAVLRSHNPLAQVPVLILPDGAVMTESAAMVLHIADLAPGAGLAPPGGDSARPAFLRWLEFLVASVYPTFTFGDDPTRWVSGEAAQQELRRRTDDYRQSLWQVVEADISPAPWVLGPRFSALDVYLSVMTRWRPRRDWFRDNCPKLHAIARSVDADPRLAKAWRRNFEQAG